MFKKILAATAMLFAAASFAAVDVNKGSAGEIDEIKGIGPTMSQRIIDARKEGEFKSWEDFMARVKGVKAKTAAKLSAEGLTVNGKPFDQAAAVAAPKAATAETAKAAPAKTGK